MVTGSIRFKESQQWSRIIPRTLQRVQIYSSHPAIYVFIDNIIKFQTTTYIKMRSIDEVAPQSRLEKEKEQSLVSLYEQYCSEQISRSHFVKTLGFKYQARTDL